jgi:toxin FitB
LDTNVVSEWTKPRPDANCREFLNTARKSSLWVSSVSRIELKRGVYTMPQSARKLALASWLENDFFDTFQGRVLSVDDSSLYAALDLVEIANRKRLNPRVADTLIAGVAVARGLIIATRNIRDFKPLGIAVFNPFTGEQFNGA